MSFIRTFVLIMFIPISLVAQDVSCEDLMQYVKSEGYVKRNVNPISLISSSWLKEVTAYSIGGKIAVIAKIKRNEYDFAPKEYIFCGISDDRWNNFYMGWNDSQLSYGERFHKYIFDYKCNCN